MSREFCDYLLKSNPYELMNQWASGILHGYGFGTHTTYDPVSENIIIRVVDIEEFEPKTSMMFDVGVMAKTRVSLYDQDSEDPDSAFIEVSAKVFETSSTERQAAAMALGVCYHAVISNIRDFPELTDFDDEAMQELYDAVCARWIENSGDQTNLT